MNEFVAGFKDCAHMAGEACRIPNGRLIREIGLGDFLENDLRDDDDAPTIAVKAIRFFCADSSPRQDEFKFAVLAVGVFLNHHHAGGRREAPVQAMKDLVALLGTKPTEEQIRRWISSHFE